MAIEKIGQMTYVDEEGNEYLLFPKTKAKCVEGLTPEAVGAAPAGYGLGDKAVTAPNNDANQITKCGFYRAYVNTPTGDWWTIQQEDLYGNGTHMIQKASCFAYTFVLHAERIVVDGKFYEWEWVNPPMVLGKEYRTTERYNGGTKYKRLFDFGQLPNVGVKGIATGIPYKDIVSVEVYATESNDKIMHAFPLVFNGAVSADAYVNAVGELVIKTFYDMTKWYAAFTITYVK